MFFPEKAKSFLLPNLVKGPTGWYHLYLLVVRHFLIMDVIPEEELGATVLKKGLLPKVKVFNESCSFICIDSCMFRQMKNLLLSGLT